MLVMLAVVVLLLVMSLKRVLAVARSIPATSIPARSDASGAVAASASWNLEPVEVVLTTQGCVASIRHSVLDYGGSLNASLPDY